MMRDLADMTAVERNAYFEAHYQRKAEQARRRSARKPADMRLALELLRDGVWTRTIAHRVDYAESTIRKWRARFIETGQLVPRPVKRMHSVSRISDERMAAFLGHLAVGEVGNYLEA